MTKKQLESIGVVHLGNKMYPNKFLILHMNEEVNLFPPYDIEDIYDLISNIAYKRGVEEGEKNKIKEIKKVLELE